MGDANQAVCQDSMRRLQEVERDTVTLKVSNATLMQSVAQLNETTARIDEKLEQLNNAMQRGRGAIWGMALAAGGVSASVATFFQRIFGNGG